MRRNTSKRIGALAAALALCLGLLSPAVPTARAAENSPKTLYISTAAELALLSRDCTLDAYSRNLTVVLTADIDLSSVDFAPIPVFCGDFNGAGHTSVVSPLQQKARTRALSATSRPGPWCGT